MGSCFSVKVSYISNQQWICLIMSYDFHKTLEAVWT